MLHRSITLLAAAMAWFAAGVALGGCSSTTEVGDEPGREALAGRYALTQPTAALVADVFVLAADGLFTRNALPSGGNAVPSKGGYSVHGSVVVFVYDTPTQYEFGRIPPPDIGSATVKGSFGRVTELVVDDNGRRTIYARTH